MLRSLKKVFLLLDAFSIEAPEWTLADLSRRVEIPKPTVHHIMMTLMDGGWIDRNAETKRFRLGMRLWEKGCLAIRQVGLRDVARPFVEALVRECGETVRLCILDVVDPHWVIYIDCVEGRQAVRADNGGALRAPSYCVATGKAILAHNPDIVKRLLARPLRGYTQSTLTDADALTRDLAATRRRGFSLNHSEFRGDVVGIAAPIRNHEGRAVAAVGVSGPAYRLGPAAVRRIAPAVISTALEISRSTGYVSNGDAHEAFTADPGRPLPVARNGRRGGAGRLPDAPDRNPRGLRAGRRQ